MAGASYKVEIFFENESFKTISGMTNTCREVIVDYLENKNIENRTFTGFNELFKKLAPKKYNLLMKSEEINNYIEGNNKLKSYFEKNYNYEKEGFAQNSEFSNGSVTYYIYNQLTLNQNFKEFALIAQRLGYTFRVFNGKDKVVFPVQDDLVDESEVDLGDGGVYSNEIFGMNKIFCGPPGTGKSNAIDSAFVTEEETKNNESLYIRILFHPEYSYNDFIGYIKPFMDGTDVKYSFSPGPFTEILTRAFLNPQKVFTLIIEELNRANASSVFGEIFQLLDRIDSGENRGKSKYEVYNKEVFDHIVSKFENKEELPIKNSSIYIPNNLNIIATMNSADQNVFIIDTAFKRRWNFEYMSIKFDECSFKKVNIDGLSANFKNKSWEFFAEKINSFMMNIKNRDLMISEDKQMGAFFIQEADINEGTKFACKVLMYLWEDVFRLDQYRLFSRDISTFTDLLNKFQNNQNIFSEIFIAYLEE